MSIVHVTAREILDSRGRPTVEADVRLADGSFGRASVPSGASTGRHEAVELRDDDPARYRGLGVLRAVEHVRTDIASAVVGRPADDQCAIDNLLIELDGTSRMARLGANATLAVSLATSRAAAVARGVPLYRHLADLVGATPVIPLPMINIVSGGLHAGRQVAIQDVLVIPTGATSFREALATVAGVFARVGDLVREQGHPPLVADEGGWAPPFESDRDAIELVARAIRDERAEAVIGLDVAASQFFDRETSTYRLAGAPERLDSQEMVAVLRRWVSEFPIASIEDGLAEDDWDGWALLSEALPSTQLLGDDLFVTSTERLGRGIEAGIGNAVLVKPNQAGTLSEAIAVVRLARDNAYASVVSARSGETEDSFIADLAIGAGVGQLKVGSVTRSSRLAKWNQVLRIEEELGTGTYAGISALAPCARRPVERTGK